MQRGAILIKCLITIISFLFYITQACNIWKLCYALWSHSVCMCTYTQTCFKGMSLHTTLHFCQILTMQSFHFHLWFSARHTSAPTPLLLLSRHSESLFSVLIRVSAVIEKSWQKAYSRLPGRQQTIINQLIRVKRAFKAFWICIKGKFTFRSALAKVWFKRGWDIESLT